MLYISNREEALASIEAMSAQEVNGYQTEDYMSQAEPEIRSYNGPQQPVDTECRTKMSEWCYQVVDFCKFSRETVAIAMSYLDRFLITPSGHPALMDRKIFQLAAMTCLYTAIKIHEPEAMEPKIVASLSRGTYTEDEVTEMERTILMALKWRMNPPTALSFVHNYMALLPEQAMPEDELLRVLELTQFQTELAVNSYEFVSINASTVALAALANALQCGDISPSIEFEFLTTVGEAASIRFDSDEVINIQDRLYFAVETASAGYSCGSLRPKTVSKRVGNSSAIHTSPRSVSAAH
jgi:hypothetical protein